MEHAASRTVERQADPELGVRALVRDRYGPLSTLRVATLDRPVPRRDGVVIRVRAASLNPIDWHIATGLPYVLRLKFGARVPRRRAIGIDVAGVVEDVGSAVTQIQPGDVVLGAADGSLAELACAAEQDVIKKPAELDFHRAAALPLVGLTAVQALRDSARLQPGQHVLINGAAGGLGTTMVQLAKVFGAEVTGVCSTRNVELVSSLGADHVIDYTVDDLAERRRTYDAVVDNVGNRSFAELRRVLTARGVYVVASGPKDGRILGPWRRALAALPYFAVVPQRATAMLAHPDRHDLQLLTDLVVAGQLSPVIEHRCDLADVPAQLERIRGGHSRGKTVVDLTSTTGRI